MTSSPNHHNVYVIELDRAVLKNKKFLDANPNMKKGAACLHVGMTGLTPEQRFENHKRGHKPGRFAKNYGKRLVPELYEQYNPMSHEQAKAMEVKLAESLRKKGFGVWYN